MLVYPPGLDFIIALYGCMLARITPAPVYLLIGARPEKSVARIRHIATDARSSLILSSSAMLPELAGHVRSLLPQPLFPLGHQLGRVIFWNEVRFREGHDFGQVVQAGSVLFDRDRTVAAAFI